MKKLEDYRQGTAGALLDEYEKAMNELLVVLEGITQEQFIKIIDPDTEDENCRSMKTIMYHVINAGYGYSYYMREREGLKEDRIRVPVENANEVADQMRAMFSYVEETVKLMEPYPEEKWYRMLILAPWKEVYDLEQLYEHAIVHVIRHRRQLEKFKLHL